MGPKQGRLAEVCVLKHRKKMKTAKFKKLLIRSKQKPPLTIDKEEKKQYFILVSVFCLHESDFLISLWLFPSG